MLQQLAKVCGAAACVFVLSARAAATTAELADGSIDISRFSPDSSASAGSGSTTVTGSATATTTFSDGTFNSADWTPGPSVRSTNAATGSIIDQQMLSGGNPGAYWQFTMSISASGTSEYRRTYFNHSATFTPSLSGPITGMTGGFTMDLLSYATIFDVYDAGIVLQQNGSVYVPNNWYGLQDIAPGWYGSGTLFSPTSAVHVGASTDWTLAAGSGSAHPDFSGSGSTIQFGLLAGTYFNSGSGTNVGGLDNWTVSVTYTAVPEPAAIPFIASACLLRRRNRRAIVATRFNT
jgi:hypothetical protein